MHKIFKRCIIIIFFLIIIINNQGFSSDSTSVKIQYKPNWKSLSHYRIPEWYKNAKFGIFIHWGVYSVPAYYNEWYPHYMYIKGSDVYKYHIKHYGPLSKFGYKNFIPMFKAQKFNPTAWAKLFKEAGAKYVVPVAEHHDGFPMYNCSYTKWNAYRMGPHKDIIAALEKAVRREGLKFGVSSHRANNWYYYKHSKKFDTGNPKYSGLYGVWHKPDAPPSQAFMKDWLLRTEELVNKFKPDLLYFDFGINKPGFEPYRKRIAAFYYNKAENWGKGVVLNYKNKAFADATAVLDIERGKTNRIRKLHWQTDTSVGKNSWGYVINEDYRTPNSLIDNLVDIVSKNGNLLLNIGPKSDGTIPQQSKYILHEIGKWLKVNGEAIYNTHPWIRYGEGNLANKKGGTESDESVYTSKDIRYTSKNDNVYAICLGWPGNELKLSYVRAGEKTKIRLLGYNKDLKWTQKDDTLIIKIPGYLQIAKNRPCKYAYAFGISNSTVHSFVSAPEFKVQKKDNRNIITLSTKTKGATIVFTTDGTSPSINSTSYSKPIVTNKPALIRAFAFKKEMFRSYIVDTSVTTPVNGLNYKYYEGTWKKIPDFKKLNPIKSGSTRYFNLNLNRRNNHWGIVFSGNLKIYTSGKYNFFLLSDDGSKLYIDGKLIINNDGSHSSREKESDKIKLSSGMHKIKVEYFQDYAGKSLAVFYMGKNILKQPIPPALLYPTND